jgi:hypothetical protein
MTAPPTKHPQQKYFQYPDPHCLPQRKEIFAGNRVGINSATSVSYFNESTKLAPALKFQNASTAV